MAGNNIPFEPGDSSAYKKGNAPVQKFSGKHRGASGFKYNYKDPTPEGNKGKSNETAVLQRAAGKKLFGGKPGGFAANYSRNT